MPHVRFVEHSVSTLLLTQQIRTYYSLAEYMKGSAEAANELVVTINLAVIVDRLFYASKYSSDLSRARRILQNGRPNSLGLAAVKWALAIHDAQIKNATWPEFAQALDILLAQ